MNTDKELLIDQLTEKVIGCAYNVGKALGSGFVESVYQNALAIELHSAGLFCEKEVPIDVIYKEQVVGQFRADLLVNKELILELKAVDKIVAAHEVQLVNYLKATGKDYGLIINFGQSVEVKRKFRLYKPRGTNVTIEAF